MAAVALTTHLSDELQRVPAATATRATARTRSIPVGVSRSMHGACPVPLRRVEQSLLVALVQRLARVTDLFDMCPRLETHRATRRYNGPKTAK